jgi:hypothetical protein
MKVMAALSTPRLGFDDNFMCAFQNFPSRGIRIFKYKGAYWEQCIERAIEQVLAAGAEAVLTCDYDTVFTGEDVDALTELMKWHPEADAVAPLQASRKGDLMASADAGPVTPEALAQPMTRLRTAHFGLTLIRATAFAKMPKPWFWSQPDAKGRWGNGRRDADLTFWDKFAEAGCQLYSANRVAVGHLELMVLWPGHNLRVVSQSAGNFMEGGKPFEVWQ